MEWNNNQSIYLQIRDEISAQIIEGHIKEETMLPSIRQLSVEYQINPLTVSKAYQLLVDSDIIEKRRGLGMFVKKNARGQLLKKEKKQFLTAEWPQLKEKIKRLGIQLEELLND